MYELYYWPGLPGRGEFVRLVLEQAGAPYRDIGREQGFEAVAAMRKTNTGFAPPYLKDGELVLAQGPAICMYLGRRHGLVPGQEFSAASVLQMVLTVMDVVTEVHDTHHPVSISLVYEDQKEEAVKRATEFLDGRLQRWMEFFSAALGNSHWLVEDSLSVADLCLFQLVEGLEYSFPNAFEQSVPKNLVEHGKRVSSLSLVASYLGSERRQAFNENGIFRRYPELDISR